MTLRSVRGGRPVLSIHSSVEDRFQRANTGPKSQIIGLTVSSCGVQPGEDAWSEFRPLNLKYSELSSLLCGVRTIKQSVMAFAVPAYKNVYIFVVMELSEGWLETVLKRDALERSVSRIISVEKEDVVNKGDNYASDISRLKMYTVLGSGRMTTRSLIMKSMPVTELRAKHLGEWGLFKREIKVVIIFRENLQICLI
ncbi:hypothetical protein AAG570_000668 [Ranatra chinensis]|uniref:Uncharacterized protein n=1 Tax=Ranatra chinensis TaxID=642074 RepID=A0ABD0ZIX9_9HEMI